MWVLFVVPYLLTGLVVSSLFLRWGGREVAPDEDAVFVGGCVALTWPVFLLWALVMAFWTFLGKAALWLSGRMK